jgi:DNA-binding NarL/FixJ family response regulator
MEQHCQHRSVSGPCAGLLVELTRTSGVPPDRRTESTDRYSWTLVSVSSVTMSMKRITVLLADDNRIVRREFRRILELEDDLEVVGEAKNGRQAVSMVKKLRPALVLMDISMPLLNGLQATCQILKAVPATKVLMLSAHSDDAYVQEATNSGAMGYLIKQTSAGSVCPAIREVQKGNTFFSPSIPRRHRKRNRKISLD